MKTTFIKTLATLALSVLAIGGFAQCPTITGIYVQQGTGTATVAAMVTPSTTAGPYYWSVSPSSGYFTPSASNAIYQTMAFNATGVYTVCVSYIDSVTMCTASTCTTINVTSTTTNTTASCNAAFTAYTNPANCMTYFTNTSTGSNLTYQWYRPGVPGMNTQTNPVMNLGNGNHWIVLYTYSNGQYCDSVSSMVTVNCGTTGTNTACQANSQFTVFADSVNAGNYFAYNQSTGTGVLSYLWNFGDGNTSTQQYPFHQYANPGQYVICLTVTSTLNGSVTCTDVSCDSSSVQRVAAGFLMNSIQVKPQGATALQENHASKNLSVYPNPVDNQVTVDIEMTSNEKRSCVITDALGKVVAEQELNGSKTIINTTTLERGIYFLTVAENGKVVKTIKLIK